MVIIVASSIYVFDLQNTIHLLNSLTPARAQTIPQRRHQNPHFEVTTCYLGNYPKIYGFNQVHKVWHYFTFNGV